VRKLHLSDRVYPVERKFLKFLLTLSVVLGLLPSWTAVAQAPQDRGLLLWTEVEDAIPLIRLKWPAPPAAVTGYVIHRKARDDTAWSDAIAVLNANTRVYEDRYVETGKVYEYRLTSMNGLSQVGYGYIQAGIKVPPVENRGKIILLVEAEVADDLKKELEILCKDLIGDGWQVLRHDVSRNATPQKARQFVVDAYNADPENVKAVFLLGHIPIFGSGSETRGPDAHTNHNGRWPADAYYGYMGDWTSNAISMIPGPVSLQVGRVDFDDMPTFGKGATGLLRQYLKKVHKYRIGEMTTGKDCLIDDVIKGQSGDFSSQTIYQTCSAIWGENANITNSYSKMDKSYTWGSYNGWGGPASVASVTGNLLKTEDIARWSKDTGIVFCSVFGSYFGKWDYQNNLMRAFLATPNYGLACAWSGRPLWYFHPMALGETIGYSARLTMNNGGGTSRYTPTNGFAQGAHIALMGDPTLRMFPVLPASNSRAKKVNEKIILSWNASKDAKVTEYHVYGSYNESGPYVRLAVTNETTWTSEAGNMPFYMIRARKLTKTASGSYYNLSQGIFAAVAKPSIRSSGTVIP